MHDPEEDSGNESPLRPPKKESDSWKRIVDGIPAIVCRIAPDGTMTFINPAGVRASGYRRDEIVGGDSWRTFFPGDEYRQVEQMFRDIADGDVRDYEMVATTKDGRRLVISWTSINQYDEAGRLVEIVGFGTDVTKRKQAEKRLGEERKLLRKMLDLQERDRRLVAYEIHDGLAQQLTGGMMQLQAVRQLDDRCSDEAERCFDAGLRLLADGLAEARRLIAGLRPMILDEYGVAAAIDHLIHETEVPEGIEVEFVQESHFDRLAPPLETALFRVAQEALNNALRHSQSSEVHVELGTRDGHVGVAVRDKGIGFDPARVEEKRFGLRGIRERARLLGGKANIDSAPGQGTRIAVEFPLVAKPPDA